MGRTDTISSWDNFWFSYIEPLNLCCVVFFSRAAEVAVTGMDMFERKVESVENVDEDDAHDVVKIVPDFLADMF